MMSHEKFMKLALSLALKGRGRVEPNPKVGCVITDENGKILSKGYHHEFGKEHAEIDALKKLNFNAKGATLYVNLEPCSHFGKTPPCVYSIVKAGVKKVVCGMVDPNPLVSGNGISYLKNHGVDVICGVLEKESFELNREFVKFQKEKIPYFTLKIASTLDGKIADRNGNSKWITGDEARKFVHRLRFYHKGILTGINTVLKDDPMLTVRHIKISKKFQPVRVILDTKLKIPLQSRIAISSNEYKTLIFFNKNAADKSKIAQLMKKGITLIDTPESSDRSKLDLDFVAKKLAELDISPVMCEGGPTLSTELLKNSLVDEMYIFYNPRILFDQQGIGMFNSSSFAKIDESIRLTGVTHRSFGNDFLITGKVLY